MIASVRTSGSGIDWGSNRCERVYAFARGYLAQTNIEDQLNKLLVLHDHEGMLSVHWGEEPTTEAMTAIDIAWEQEGKETSSDVQHLIVKMEHFGGTSFCPPQEETKLFVQALLLGIDCDSDV